MTAVTATSSNLFHGPIIIIAGFRTKRNGRMYFADPSPGWC